MILNRDGAIGQLAKVLDESFSRAYEYVIEAVESMCSLI